MTEDQVTKKKNVRRHFGKATAYRAKNTLYIAIVEVPRSVHSTSAQPKRQTHGEWSVQMCVCVCGGGGGVKTVN